MSDPTLKAIIEKRRGTYTENYRLARWAEATKVYTEDCRYLEAGMEDIKGREELAVAIKDMAGMGYPVLKEQVFEVIRGGEDWCVERSAWQLIKPDGVLGLRGLYICLWKKIGDEWYARMECCNGGSD